jgi:signal peptidase II
MLYFPLIEGHFPTWFPFWAGESFEFFRPVFNLADASISSGVGLMLVFQKRFFSESK